MEIKELVDEYAKWDSLGKQAKAETDKIKARIQEIAVAELENSKDKTVRYFGTGSNIATVTTSETVKMVSYWFLKSVLGNVTGDFVKEDVTYKMSDPFKKIMAPIFLGNYIKAKASDVIEEMGVDEKTAKLLTKKLKGDPQKDAKVLESVGMSPDSIKHWTYFIAEAMAYEKFVRLMEVCGYQEGSPEFAKALADIRQAVIVEEGLKIGIDYEEE